VTTVKVVIEGSARLEPFQQTILQGVSLLEEHLLGMKLEVEVFGGTLEEFTGGAVVRDGIKHLLPEHAEPEGRGVYLFVIGGTDEASRSAGWGSIQTRLARLRQAGWDTLAIAIGDAQWATPFMLSGAKEKYIWTGYAPEDVLNTFRLLVPKIIQFDSAPMSLIHRVIGFTSEDRRKARPNEPDADATRGRDLP